MKKVILIVFFFMTTGLLGIAQEHTKTLVATYIQGYRIPKSVYGIEDKQTKENVLKELSKKTSFVLCYQEGKCGFTSSASTTIKKGNFLVSGERGFYMDLKKREKVSSEVILDEHFLVHSPLNTIEWNITDEEMEIAGKLCTKATCLSDDGEVVTAWFCSEMPIPIGPSEYYQGLPGLIFALEMGNVQYEIQKLEYVQDIKGITPPSTGRKMEKEQFDKLREEIYERHKRELSGNESGVQIIRL
ncbi:GLPGLI family protein [Bacteroides heparinolyticus]|uniref:GLPGLI family protein n=1 Tax=Prevotella heparinolytica TaxID=28113 RepID=UPI0035A0F6DA